MRSRSRRRTARKPACVSVRRTPNRTLTTPVSAWLPRRLIGVMAPGLEAAEEPRADDQIRTGRERVEQQRDFVRVVLPVGVEEDQHLARGALDSEAQRMPFAAVSLDANQPRAGGLGAGGGAHRWSRRRRR